jgi:LAO/AO transport system kinase
MQIGNDVKSQMPDANSFAEKVLAGNRLALARLLTQIENETTLGFDVLDILFPRTGNAHLIGVTGAPGTGKSSLVNQLALAFRKKERAETKRVAIVAVDPSSPFTGGAILGDRVRMRDLAGDPGIFIRSMASRGSLGGLATTTSGIVLALDAAGYDVILVETVGVGQAEVDIVRLAHTTVVVEAPGLGDEIQAIKAGLMEIADILVVNKADKPGVEITERALRSMLQMRKDQGRHVALANRIKPYPDEVNVDPSWFPPVLKTVAIDGKGVGSLHNAIAQHYNYLSDTKSIILKEQARLKYEVEMLLREILVARWRESIREHEYQLALTRVVQREISPWKAVKQLIEGR